MDDRLEQDPDAKSEEAQTKCICELCSCYKKGKLNIASKSLHKLPACILNVGCLTTVNLNYNQFKSFPDIICQASFAATLETLSLKGNDLRSLPENLGALANLQVLDLSENLLTKLPDCVCDLVRLRSFKCVANMLKQLPDNLNRLVALEELHLDENKLKSLPDSFGTLTALQTLEISNNNLVKLPANIGQLHQLVCLNLSYNSLTELPKSFELLDSLEELDISNCRLKFLPETFPSAKCIRKLYCDCNEFCTLPTWISSMPCIEELSFEDNGLVKAPFLPDFGATCVRLRHFNFGGNFIEILPDNIGQLSRVEYVHLGSVLHELERRNFQNGNWITRLPESFGHMRALRQLRLDENQLVCLPESFGELVSLETLDLGQNKLTELPASFGLLRSLKSCQLSKNFLEVLPDNFGKLTALTELRLDNNLLLELPASFEELTQLKVLDLFNNQLTNIPMCLQFTTNLSYLELDGNNFGIALEDVPHIMFHTKYADRNPDLKNTWRGRNRKDIPIGSTKFDESKEPSLPAENLEQVNKLLTALKQGSALWKTHTDGNSVREKFDHKVAQNHAPMRSMSDVTLAQLEGRLPDMDLECSHDTSDLDASSQGTHNEDDEDTEIDESAAGTIVNLEDEYEPEDWDKELEETDKFSVYDDFHALRKMTCVPMSYAIPPKNGFLPADNHPKPLLRYPIQSGRNYAGQFDDAE